MMFILFLMPVIVAIIVGYVTNSWIWGLVSFPIALLLIPRIILWLFGSPRKGRVVADERQIELLDKLEMIGSIKQELPLDERGWCNSLGLYVQLREAAGMSRLQAGDKRHAQIDAWRNYSTTKSAFEWKVKKYNPGDWERLVEPILDIANWLRDHGGLPKEYREAFNKAIEVFQKEARLDLPP